MEGKPVILVVDDRVDIVRYCERCLGTEYVFVHAVGWRDAKGALGNREVTALLLDRDFTQAPVDQLLGPREDCRNEGLHILDWLRHEHPELPVVMVTGQGDLSLALRASDLGADFLSWDDVAEEPAVLSARLQVAIEHRRANDDIAIAPFRRLGIVAESPAFCQALRATARALPGRGPILLLGATGTGKDSVAYAVHALSGDPARPFVAVNVAELNPNLIESELFGHTAFAFTDAKTAAPGRLRSADGGTLFLNEIGDLPLEQQAKLLTALDRGEVVPVGGVQAFRTEFRLIAATSRDLYHLVDAKLFREDLLHRINCHTIQLPPLKDRPEDLPALAHAFLRGTEAGRTGAVMGLAREAMEYLVSLPWSGNVREIRAVIEAACASARHTITVADIREVIRRVERCRARPVLPPYPLPSMSPEGVIPPLPAEFARIAAEDIAFAERTHDEITRSYYYYLMRVTGGNKTLMKNIAGISKSTIYDWAKKYAANGNGNGEGERKAMEGEDG